MYSGQFTGYTLSQIVFPMRIKHKEINMCVFVCKCEFLYIDPDEEQEPLLLRRDSPIYM